MNEKRSVLIVDDDPAILRGLALFIGRYAKVTTADSAGSAIAALESDCFDTIVMDYDLGNGTGHDVLDHMSRIGCEVPVIMLTAVGTKDVIIRSLHYHVFGFAEKPFRQEHLDALIKSAFQEKERIETAKRLAALGENAGQLIHEIGNALNALTMQIGVLHRRIRSFPDPELIKGVERVSAQVSRLRTLFEGARGTLRSADSIPVRPVAESVPLHEILSLALESCSEKARRDQTRVSVTVPPEIEVYGDRLQLAQVFTNLVINSIDAVSSLSERWITITSELSPEGILIRVTDSGQRIPDAVQKKLFTTLYTTKAEKGTGLGLTIVKKIVENHQGHVYLNTDSPHTQFVVILPGRVHNRSRAA